jgi:hypothetical protein
MAVTYLTENHKYACQVRNGNVEVQDLPQDDNQDREMNGNEGNEERAEEDKPNGEQEAQEQDNERHDQVSLHLHNPGLSH